MKTIEIDPPLLRSLLVLATVIEARDPFTGGHVWRTSRYARLLATAAGLEKDDVFMAQLGGLVHDLGKVGIPDAILLKQARITPAEFRVIALHPEIGHDIVVNHPLALLVDRQISQHHLRMDRQGYPARWRDQTPWFVSRIVSVADAFDAMTSTRPYRRELLRARALAVLEEERGRQFDAGLVDLFIALARDGRLDHVIGHAADDRLMLSCPECGPIIAPPAKAADGDKAGCPSCLREFVLHFARGAPELEWTGRGASAPAASPDLEAVEDALRDAPRRVGIDPDPRG
ncbi:MAG: HD domain-containing protein [Elusimicrobia bacterium]|nr:HD domain-containing protein [Elusimicrobiota bacterium]